MGMLASERLEATQHQERGTLFCMNYFPPVECHCCPLPSLVIAPLPRGRGPGVSKKGARPRALPLEPPGVRIHIPIVTTKCCPSYELIKINRDVVYILIGMWFMCINKVFSVMFKVQFLPACHWVVRMLKVECMSKGSKIKSQ